MTQYPRRRASSRYKLDVRIDNDRGPPLESQISRLKAETIIKKSKIEGFFMFGEALQAESANNMLELLCKRGGDTQDYGKCLP